MRDKEDININEMTCI